MKKPADCYDIHKDGRVFSQKARRFAKPTMSNGYERVRLTNCAGGTTLYYLQRIIWGQFHGEAPKGFHIKKIDPLKGCELDNLTLVKSKRGRDPKLNSAQQSQAIDLINQGLSIEDVANRFQVGKTTIRRLIAKSEAD